MNLDQSKINQKIRSFPTDFLWGVATSHFQIEGNPYEISNRLSDWSNWTQDTSRVADQSSADKACEFFQRYPQDLSLLNELNLNAFRLSLNWAAIFPAPRIKDDLKVNKEMIT